MRANGFSFSAAPIRWFLVVAMSAIYVIAVAQTTGSMGGNVRAQSPGGRDERHAEYRKRRRQVRNFTQRRTYVSSLAPSSPLSRRGTDSLIQEFRPAAAASVPREEFHVMIRRLPHYRRLRAFGEPRTPSTLSEPDSRAARRSQRMCSSTRAAWHIARPL
jgi:hypothetical protein